MNQSLTNISNLQDLNNILDKFMEYKMSDSCTKVWEQNKGEFYKNSKSYGFM